MLKRVCLFCAVAFLCAANLQAETIILKSGEELDGIITDRSKDHITISADGKEKTYFISEIETIDGEQLEEGMDSVNRDDLPSTEAIQPGDPGILDAPAPIPAPPATLDDSQRNKMTLVAIIAVIFFLFIGACVYVYMGLCLYFIAKKTNQEMPWWAWVPVLNLLLMCRIAGLPWWWALIFFALYPLQMVPVIGLIIAMPASLAWTGYVYYKIACARNKPGWWGVLVGVPLANFVAIGYLAFSE